ncbi:MAG: efflux RND transporter periplasmic adaptor subunit [Candidatus Cloacimonadaceae bacterium]|nr:efflux RND transporter periplasmic adaptor subunit [Candidatus Cloacimonadaceae bacterium]MDP3114898.1 efflux RND transporter periplasmic adaptor subunit [Candidatus Cloacimonadaceae bacterium]
MKRIILLALIILVGLFACGKKQSDSKNMQQIQQEQGIPVRVKAMTESTFIQELRYNAILNGIEESTAQAMVSDIVLQIHAQIGERVSKGQLIMSFPQNTPAAQYEQASTAFNAQKQVYERMQRLFAQGAISQQDLDNRENAYKVSKSNLAASEQMIKVRAPISGVITNIFVNQAEKVSHGADLFTVSGTGGYKAVLMVPDSEVKNLRVGTPATAVIGTHSLKGKISRIGLAVDPNSKAVRVEADFPGTNKNISYGSTAQVSLNVLSKANVLVVERAHIVSENESRFVWLAEGNRAKRVEIQTGLDNQLEYEVLSGISPGDALITEGINQLAENALIRVIE